MQQLRRRLARFKGWTIGLDLHRTFIQFVVFDARGNEAGKGRVESEKEELEKLVRAWRARGAVQVALEACGSFWWVFCELKELLGREKVHVAHAAKVRVIAASGDKNDENDAWWLGYLLWERRLPEAYVAEGVLREMRIAGRELRYNTDSRADLLRRFRSHLVQEGAALPKAWWTSKARRAVAQKLLQGMAGERRRALLVLYRQIVSLGKVMRVWRKRIEHLGSTLPMLQSIEDGMPGLKTITGALAYGELGDPRRFRSAKAYARATGLTPSNRETGGKRMSGGITREGSPLARWAYTRAVIACLRCRQGPGGAVRQWVQERWKHKPKKHVIVAAARKLAEGVWRLCHGGEVFDLARAFPARRGGGPGGRAAPQRFRQRTALAAASPGVTASGGAVPAGAVT